MVQVPRVQLLPHVPPLASASSWVSASSSESPAAASYTATADLP